MKYLSKTFLFCCLTISAVLMGQFGCSSSPPASQNTAGTQPTPTPTAETASSLATVTPTPAVTSSPAPADVAKAPSGSSPGSRTPESSVAKPAAPVVEKPAPPRVFTLPSGSVISVYTASDLSTKSARGGQRFTASLGRTLSDGDWVIARKGAPVEGVVVSSDPGGKVSGVASISVRLESLTLADGRKVDLSTSSYSKQAKSSKKKDAAKIGIGAGIGAAIGAIAGGGKGAAIGAGAGGAGGTGVVLATRGDPAVIPSESLLTFRLTSPVRVTKR